MTLLNHVRALVEAERGLTEALEQTLPLLSSNSNNLGPPSFNKFNSFSSSVIPPSSSSKRGAEPPLLPTPRSPGEVPTILAVARAYSLRTSAPPAWNTNLPVVGFATPNPLPHQLRGGALGAMQLSLAREEKKRKRKEVLAEEAQQKEREKKMRLVDEGEKAKKERWGNSEVEEDVVNNETEFKNIVNDNKGNSLQSNSNAMMTGGKDARDPKRQEMIDRHRVRIVQQHQRHEQQQMTSSSGQPPEKLLKKSMNLSESSSSSSSSEEGSDNE